MIVIDYIYAICGAVAVWFLCGLLFSMARPARKAKTLKESNLFTLFQPVLFFLAPLTGGIIWPGYRRWINGRITAAGLQEVVLAEELFVSRFLFAALIWLSTLAFPNGLRVLLVLMSLGYPELWIISMVQTRHAEIRRNMPYFVDLLSLCTGAGLDFGSAIDRVLAKAEDGPLMQEFKQARRDVSLGVSQSESLVNLSRRVQMPELTSFVAIMVQALRMGSSISNILDAQAEKMRLERYEKAERIGAQAQQKILIPLLFLILPAFILLGIVPIIIELVQPIINSGLMEGL